MLRRAPENIRAWDGEQKEVAMLQPAISAFCCLWPGQYNITNSVAFSPQANYTG
jgi:hypothetical protein